MDLENTQMQGSASEDVDSCSILQTLALSKQNCEQEWRKVQGMPVYYYIL